MPDPWRLTIKAITDAELERGFRRLIERGGDHPPNLAQFTRLCRDIADHDGPARPPHNALPAPKYDRFHCFAGRQLFSFIRQHEFPPECMPAILRRKNEIIEAARVDPELESGNEREHAEMLHGVLWNAWATVIQAHKAQQRKSA